MEAADAIGVYNPDFACTATYCIAPVSVLVVAAGAVTSADFGILPCPPLFRSAVLKEMPKLRGPDSRCSQRLSFALVRGTGGRANLCATSSSAIILNIAVRKLAFIYVCFSAAWNSFPA